MTEQNAIVLRELLEDDGVIDVVTPGNIAIPVTLQVLEKLTYIPPNTRKPNQAELMMFANMCIEHKANPYLKECWLVHMRGHYEPIIAAQVRVRKAQAQPDYDGYSWGWILQDGTRCEPGKASKALGDGIIGVWGEVKRKGIEKPWYHEVFLSEYKGSTKPGSSWGDRPLTMILKVCRDQAHKFAYSDQMGNLCTENELGAMQRPPEALPGPDAGTREARQLEDVKVVDSSEAVETLLSEVLTKFGGCLQYKLQLTDEQLEAIPGEILNQAFALQAAFAIPHLDDETPKPDYAHIESFTLEKLNIIRQHLEYDGVHDDVASMIPVPLSEEEVTAHAKEKLGSYKYKCKNKKCGNMFDKPLNPKSKKPLCPKCLSGDFEIVGE